MGPIPRVPSSGGVSPFNLRINIPIIDIIDIPCILLEIDLSQIESNMIRSNPTKISAEQ